MAEQDLTRGNVFTVLLKFAVPFFFANVLQALYGAADLVIVGQFCGPAEVAAVATGSQVMQTITGLCIGLTTGGTIIIGQLFGSGKRKDIANAVSTIFTMFAFIAMMLTMMMFPLLDDICNLMQVPPEAMEATKSYLLFCSSGILFIIGFNAISGILRGLGDSKTPFFFISIACVINIAADLCLVGIFDLKAMGAALATIGAQGISLLLSICFLIKEKRYHRYFQAGISFHIRLAKRILGVGMPIAAQEGLVNISFLVITGIVNGLGVIASASLGVVEKLIVFSMLPTTAFASAVAAMTAQNKGAGKMKRAYHCLYCGIGISMLFGIAFFLFAQYDAAFLIRLFTTDPFVIETGAAYLSSYSVDCMIVCFVFCMNAFFSGSGNIWFPLIHSLITTLLLRLPLSYLFCITEDMFMIGLAAPISSCASLLLCILYLRKVKQHPIYFSFHAYKRQSPLAW